MIGFVEPWLLAAGLAAAVPIVLHLIRRREIRRVVFPAVRYLRQAERRHARRLRLRHLALLALRVGIVLLAAAAAAGPLIGRGGPHDHRPTALALVVDNSQSSAVPLHGRRLIDHFVDRARLDLELAGHADRIAVFAAADPEPHPVGPDLRAASAALTDLTSVPAVANLPRALRNAREWAISSAEGHVPEIHLFTDLQRVSLFDDVPRAARLPESGPRASHRPGVVAFVPAPSSESNGAVGVPEPEVRPINAGLETRVAVPLLWHGPAAPPDPVVVRFIQSDEVAAVAETPFGSTALVRLPPQPIGWLQGRFETDPYGLADDDRRYFTWYVRSPPDVAVVGNAGRFLTTALDALASGGRVRRAPPERAEVWITMSGVGVEEALAAGRAAIVVPPDSVLDLPRLNSRLERARIPWRYEPATGTGRTRLSSATTLDALAGLEVRRFYRLAPTTPATTDSSLAKLETGAAWLVRGTTPGGSAYLLLSSPLTVEASALPVSAAMIPFVDAAVGDWARVGDIGVTELTGLRRIRLPARAHALHGPDGVARSAEGGSWFAPRRPGNYRVSDGDSTLAAFSVNVPTAESDLRRGSREALEEVLPGADWTWRTSLDLEEWRGAVFRARRGRHAWRPIVAALIVLAILESSLAASGRRPGTGSSI